MIVTLRRGLGRRSGLFPVPPRLVEIRVAHAGKCGLYERAAGPLVADASALARLGWTATADSRAALAELTRH